MNIGAGTLDRPIEYTVATLLHECCHLANLEILNVQDCSRGGTYHNKYFKAMAESVGLIVTRAEKYGLAHTEPSDQLIKWILDHDIEEIRIHRTEPSGIRVTGGNTSVSVNQVSGSSALRLTRAKDTQA